MSGLRSLHTMNLFSRFFQENQEKFLAFAYSYLRDKAEAEDVVMESMITLWENRDRWEENSNLHALLLTIIKNKALHVLEHKQVRLRAEEDHQQPQPTRTGLTHIHLESLRTGPDIQHGNTAYRK